MWNELVVVAQCIFCGSLIALFAIKEGTWIQIYPITCFTNKHEGCSGVWSESE